ncbi:virion structural protein [Pseudomonas phage PA1C]|nr:virion structural protein [Pseudomonas phage PA1C]
MFEALLGIGEYKSKQGWVQLQGPDVGRNQSTSVVVGDKLYIFGGRRATTNAFNTVSVYDFLTDEWKELPAGANVNLRAAGGLVDNKFYVFGGYTGSADTNTMIEFTIDGETITPVTRSNGGLAVRNSHCMSAIDNKVYLFGGNGAQGIMYEFKSYNTDNFTVANLTPPYQIRYATLTSHGRRLYTLGGYETANTSVTSFRSYNVDNNTWTAHKNGLVNRNRHSAVALNNKIYVFGGQSGTSSTPNTINNDHIFSVYDIETDTWSNIILPPGKMPPTRFYANMEVYNGKIYLSGGYTNGVYHNDLWVYDPENP